MSIRAEEGEELRYQCPVCDAKMAIEPPLPPHDAPCPACGYPLWCCRRRTVDDVVVLKVLRDRTPEVADIERLAEALVSSGGVPHVVVDLSEDDLVTSAFMARLVALNKRVGAAKGRLILCGLQPAVSDAFRDSTLDRLFDICDDEEAALASL